LIHTSSNLQHHDEGNTTYCLLVSRHGFQIRSKRKGDTWHSIPKQSHLSTQWQIHLMATHSALRPAVGTQAQSILHPSVVSGYGIGSIVIDPRLFSQVFTTALALMTQLQNEQRSSLNAASSADSSSSRKSPSEERRGNRWVHPMLCFKLEFGCRNNKKRILLLLLGFLQCFQ